MALGKQAKVLSKGQQEAILAYLTGTRYAARNRVIFLLSVKAGLRAKEIAGLTWAMVTDSDGQVADKIALQDTASKGRSGRHIWMHKELRQALVELQSLASVVGADHVVRTERSEGTSAQVMVNLLASWYRRLGFEGCSSHSGRRTFITNAARKISLVGGSLRDVQVMAGHAALGTTQRYIESDAEAQKRVVEMM
tara:strand:+ start:1958 stop:2542 length:585 start_codon:yes stop_codon:yes gene_type:complete